MKLIRYHNSPLYHPARNFTHLREEMDRLFDVAFPALGSSQQDRLLLDGPAQFPVDLYQGKDAFVVRAELPGFRKEEISVDVAYGILTVSAHQKLESAGTTKDEGNNAVQERCVSRAISLPELIDLEKIKAGYENGVLTVTLPKREEAKPKQIAIEVK